MDGACRGAGGHGGYPANQSGNSDFDRPIKVSVEPIVLFGFGSYPVDGGPSQVDEEVLFAAEMVIEGAFGYPGSFDDGVDGDVVEVLGLPQADRGVDELTSCLP